MENLEQEVIQTKEKKNWMGKRSLRALILTVVFTTVLNIGAYSIKKSDFEYIKDIKKYEGVNGVTREYIEQLAEKGPYSSMPYIGRAFDLITTPGRKLAYLLHE